MDAGEVTLDPNWKVTNVTWDHDEAKRFEGTYYLSEQEYQALVVQGVVARLYPVDPAQKQKGIPLA